MASRALASTGTCTVSPALSTEALLVPKAIVDTGTWAALAAAMASASDRPVVLFPSDRRTIRAAGALAGDAELPLPLPLPPAAVDGALPSGRALSEVKIASPSAVPGLVARRSSATCTAWWSVLG